MEKCLVIKFKDGQRYIRLLCEGFKLIVTSSAMKLINGGKTDYYLLEEIKEYSIVNKLEETE